MSSARRMRQSLFWIIVTSNDPAVGAGPLETAQEIKSTYVDDGRVKVEYRHYAVLGPESRLMAQGTECAGEQGEFWKYHDAIFQERSRERGVQGQIVRANTLGLDVPKFTACMENETYEHIVDGDLAQAKRGWRNHPANYFHSLR